MSQHQASVSVSVKFKNPVDGVRSSSCGRFIATHDKQRACRGSRWILTDLELGREVYCSSLLRHCRRAAEEIVAAPSSVHPCASARQLDDEWVVDVAARPGASHDAGDLVAWHPTRCSVLSLEPHDTLLARYRARRLAKIEERRALNAEVELELIKTDAPAPRVSASVVVHTVTFRAAAKTKQQRETEDRSKRDEDEDRRGALVVLPPREGEQSTRLVPRAWREHALKLTVAPLPHPWVDLVFSDDDVRYGVRVHIRDSDVKRDVWRRCRHAIKEVSSAV